MAALEKTVTTATGTWTAMAPAVEVVEGLVTLTAAMRYRCCGA